MRKLALVGCGGINSWVAKHIHELSKTFSFGDSFYVKVFDDDIVEEKNILRENQNYQVGDLMSHKVDAVSRKYNYDFEAIKITPENIGKLEIFDDIILGVDNNKAREIIYKYCLEKHKNLIDLRAQGTHIAYVVIRPTEKKPFSYYQNKYFGNESVMERVGSCQMASDVADDHIENGNKIIAFLGVYGIYLKIIRKENLSTNEWQFAY